MIEALAALAIVLPFILLSEVIEELYANYLDNKRKK